MIVLKKADSKKSKGMQGFTLLELMIVVAMVSVLSSIAIFNGTTFRKKALDTTALSDARNLVDSVINAALGQEDVNYFKDKTKGAVGDKDTSGNPRSPVLILSPGVAARITGDSIQPPDGNTTIVTAWVYHTNGTPDPISPSLRKEYFCFINGTTGQISLP